MNHHAEIVTALVGYLTTHKSPLLHVTDQCNLLSIGEHGLLSKAELQARSIVPSYAGGDPRTWALDADHALWNYVFLGFSKMGAMPAHKHEVYRRRPRTLHIHPQILHCPGVQIALRRANHRGTKRLNVSRAAQEIDGEVFEQVLTGTYNWHDIKMTSRINRVFNYEVLVPTTVPPEYIIGVG